MPRLALALLALVLAGPAAASPTPAKLANRVLETLREADSIRYSVIIHPGEELRDAPLVIRADVVATLDPAAGFESARVDCRIAGDSIPRGARMLYTQRRGEAQLINHVDRTVMAGPAAAVLAEPAAVLAALPMRWLDMFHTGDRWSLYGDEDRGDRRVRPGVREGRELCDVLIVGEGDEAIEMAISRRTSLPVRLRAPGGDLGRLVFQIDRPATGVRIADSMFEPGRVPREFRSIPVGDADGAPEEGPASRAVGTGVGELAPEWELKDADGRAHRLSDYRGRIVVMDFWATWCGPCKRVMPALQKMHEELSDRGVVVLGVNAFERSPDMAAGFMRSNRYTYGLLLGGDRVADRYGVTAIPAFYVIGREGEILFKGSGANEKAAMEAAVRDALAR